MVMKVLFGLFMWLGGSVASAQTHDLQADSLSALAPEPVFAVGTTVVNVHFAGLDRRPCKDVTLVLTPFVGLEQERYSAEIDAITAMAVFSLELKGTGRCHLTNYAIPHTSDIFLAPGETVDVWCDMEEVLRRDRELTSPGPVLNMIPVRTNGRYADVNNRDHVIREGLADPSGPEHRHHAATFASSAEAADALLADHSACLAAISDEPVPSIQKALKVIELRLSTFCAAATAGKITAEEDLRRVFMALDLDDTRLLLGQYAPMAAFAASMWPDLLAGSPLLQHYEALMSLAMLRHGSMTAGQKAALERARFYSQVLLTD